MRLDGAVKIYSPNTTSRSFMTDTDGLKCVHYGDIYKNYSDREINSSNIHNSISLKFPEHKIIKRNAIIIADVSETVDDWGHVTFIKYDGIPFINGTHTFAIVSECATTLRYLFYYLRDETNRKRLRQFLTGVTVFQMNIKSLNKYKIELPLLDTRTRIADILSAYDDAIENNKCRIALLEQVARDLYREWFVRMRFPCYKTAIFIKGLPEGWEINRLGDIINITSSKRIYLSDYVDEGVPFYRSKEVIQLAGGQAVSEPLFIERDKFNSLKDRFGVPLENDILITSVGTIGFSYLVDKSEFYFKDGNLTWLQSGVLPERALYLYQWLNSDEGKNSLLSSTIGTSQSALTIENLKKIKLVLPDDNVLTAFYEITKGFVRLSRCLQQKSQNLVRQRDMLLSRLMSGKLEVNHDNIF